MDAKSIAAGLGGESDHGGYLMARCPCHDDTKASLSITDSGGKVLVKCHAGCEQGAIVDELKSRGLWPESSNSRKKKIVAEYNYTDEYGALLYQVVRFDPKDFRQRRPSGDGWNWKLGDVRQVPYRLPDLLEGVRSGRAILIVEGEKDVDRLASMNVVATCNAGGAGKWRAEWASFFSKAKVVVVPDNDDPGRSHALQVCRSLHDVAEVVGIVNLPGIPEKEDISWWLGEGGGDRIALNSLIREAWQQPYRPPVKESHRARPLSTPPLALVGSNGAMRVPQVVAERREVELPQSILALHQELGMKLSKGKAKPTLDNAVRLLEGYEEFVDRWYFDSFQGNFYSRWGSPNGEWYVWSKHDTLRLTLVMQRVCGLDDVKDEIVHKAVHIVAKRRTSSELVEWLDSLKWDGTSRLGRLLADGMGAQDNTYSETVGVAWLTSLCARAYQPGCQVDTMPVFEGAQGVGKSQAMRILGGKWFTEAHENVTNKDFFQTLQGKWIVEIAEMDAFRRAEVDRIKAIITCTVDRFRAAFGRDVMDWPRQCVFVGTTNRDDWQRDETGARRFWPVLCDRINLTWLKENREQLFAEAVARYKDGGSWWEIDEKQAQIERQDRYPVDEWEFILRRHCDGRDLVFLSECMEWLEIPVERWGKPEQTRVGVILRRMRYKSRVERVHGDIRRAYRHLDTWK